MLVIAAAALAAAGCRQGGGVAGQPLLAPVPPAYPASLAPWPPPVPTAAIGRGVAPSYAVPAAIAGTAAVQGPIVVERVWPVPDPAAEARAVVTGTIGDRFAVEVVAVDAGEVRWRDLVACQAPVVHVTAEVIVCADARGIVAVDVAAGVAVWRSPLQFAGADGGLVVARRPPAEPDPGAASPAAGSPAAPDPGATDAGVAAPVDPGAIVVLDAATGLDLATVAPPAGVRLDEIRVACRRGDDLELWAWGADHLDRLAIGVGGAVAVATVALPRAPARVSPCGDPALVELPIPGSIERALYAIRPDAPRLADAPLIERGFWRRGPGEVGVATAAGVEVRDAALAPVAVLSSAEVGRELDSRGARRLVRGHGGLAVLLEDDVPIAYLDVPSHADSAVLGDRYLLAGGWQAPARSLADRVDRFRLPDGDRAVVVPSIMGVTPPVPPVDVPDLPAPVAAGAPVELADAAAWDVGAVLVDPAAPGRLYVAVLEQRPDADHGAGLAAFDLATRRWAWHSADACPPGTPVALAATAAVVVCGSRRSTPAAARSARSPATTARCAGTGAATPSTPSSPAAAWSRSWSAAAPSSSTPPPARRSARSPPIRASCHSWR
ncbi:MAG: hypothetical protein H6709_06510 [Kofleriaceae bacterium]|nr:hypothetical protein [Kofleriaceae bacterium]